MEDGQRFEKKMEMEYSSNSGTLQVNAEHDSEMFQANANELELDPNLVDIQSMKINRKGVIVNFSAMALCETDGEQFVTKMYGVTMDGKSPDSFFNEIHSLKSHMFGEKWEESVERQRNRMEKRRKKISGSVD